MIHVLGLGLNASHRTPDLLDRIDKADWVAGGQALLDDLNITNTRRIVFTDINTFAARIREAGTGASVCVLADGDPLLFGLGASLLRFFSPRELLFEPNISAMQTACARFGLPWHDCALVSLHGRSDQSQLFAALTHKRLVAVYTDTSNSPDALARLLLDRGVHNWRMHVAEKISHPDERLFSSCMAEVAKQAWKTPNLVLLEQTAAPILPLVLGLPDAALEHEKALMSKQPVRALALSLLRLPPDAVFWDLGAGSGVISLEAARLLTTGHILAVERCLERVCHIRENIQRTGAWLVDIRHADIRDFLAQTHAPRPSHIFVGGGVNAQSLAHCRAHLLPGGRLVVAAVLLSTLETSRMALTDWQPRVHQLMHHVSSPLASDLRLTPANPVFLIEAQKPADTP